MKPDEILAERCQQLGQQICLRAAPIRRLANDRAEAPMTDLQWMQHGQVAAFFAFTEHGGEAEQPDAVDWTAHALVATALRYLQLFALGSQSDVYDQIIRERSRRDGRNVNELTWDAWIDGCDTDWRLNAAAAASPLRAVRDGEAVRRYYDFWSKHERPAVDDTFARELTRLLRPQEAVWLIRRYRDGVPTSTLAREFMKKDARYQTADGYTRAVRYIDVVIHRAKVRCRAQLASQWQMMAQEVA